MPTNYTPVGSTVAATIPALSDTADITAAFEDYHDDIAPALDLKAPKANPQFTGTVTFGSGAAITLPNNSVATANIQDTSISTAKVIDKAITGAKIADGTIVDANISSSAAISQSKISNLTTDLSAKASSTDLTSLTTTVTTLKNTVDYTSTTSTSYTLGLSDAGKLVSLNSGSAITLTIPANATTAIPVNSRVDILQLGSGQITVTPAVGVTLNSKGSKTKVFGQYSAATLIKIDTNSWVLIGDLTS